MLRDIFRRGVKVDQPGQNHHPEDCKKTRAAAADDPFKEEKWPFPPSRAAIEDKSSDDTDIEPIDPPSSIDLEPPVPVPRSKRRGLCGRFAVLAEVENPRSYPRRVKWFITFVVAVAGMMAPMGSSIFFPSLSQVAQDLKTTPTVTNLSVAVYMLSMSIFPLWWSSFSETLGRRTIYLISFGLMMVFNVFAAISPTIGMLITMRLLSGGASASVQAVGAGTMADLWEPRERGRAIGIFYLGPLCGPLLAPIVGGALANRWGWRSTLWFIVLFGGVLLPFIFFALPETLPRYPLDAVLNAQADVEAQAETEAQVEAETGAKVEAEADQTISATRTGTTSDSPLDRALSCRSSRQVVVRGARALRVLKVALFDPLKITLYLRFPAVLLTVYYASITFGCLYILNVSIQETCGNPPYSYSTLIVGLLYLPNSLGYIFASLLGGRWMDNIMQREAKKANRYDEQGQLIYRPEDRMRENAWLGAFLYPAALIWYGWTTQRGVYWLVPMVANFFFGIGSMLIFSIATTMLTEFMPNRSSSGVALNNFVPNIFSSIGCVVASPIMEAIGNGWLFTIMGSVAALSSLVIFAMKIYGSRWRKSMDAHLR
jgi:multidrug resistance protein